MYFEKYSIGIGDRFGHQGIAQLEALVRAKEKGLNITPVWNKSIREHLLIGSSSVDQKIAADKAVEYLHWKDSYFIDADHIGLKTVDNFLDHCNFFTIDVADFIGREPGEEDLNSFLKSASEFIGVLEIPDVSNKFEITKSKLTRIAKKYLYAIKEASRIYSYIKSKKTEEFITEVSLDENPEPQTPEELFFILFGLSLEKIPVRTIAPKFTGRFNKGVDYVGDVNQFAREFEDDVAVINYAVKLFSLPENLKLSIHSGSDKFSIYGPMNRIIKKYNAGLHLKTAGTTWLEELIGLAEAGGEGLLIAKEVYQKSYERMEELSKPYETVIDIDMQKLPKPEVVNEWTSKQYTDALGHDSKNKDYNIHFRQLLHLGYKIAAEMGSRYTDSLKKYEDIVGRNVTENIFNRHIVPLFLRDEVELVENKSVNHQQENR